MLSVVLGGKNRMKTSTKVFSEKPFYFSFYAAPCKKQRLYFTTNIKIENMQNVRFEKIYEIKGWKLSWTS